MPVHVSPPPLSWCRPTGNGSQMTQAFRLQLLSRFRKWSCCDPCFIHSFRTLPRTSCPHIRICHTKGRAHPRCGRRICRNRRACDEHRILPADVFQHGLPAPPLQRGPKPVRPQSAGGSRTRFKSRALRQVNSVCRPQVGIFRYARGRRPACV